MSNVGRTIKDFYCNGYFGRTYDLTDSIIIAEGIEYIVIRKENGYVDFCNFQTSTSKDGVQKVETMDPEKKQQLIDSWCQ